MAFVEKMLKMLASRASLTIASIFATGSYVTYKDKHRYEAMEQMFAQGNILPPFAGNRSETIYFPRPELEDQLRVALSPEVSNQYYLISGGVGSGKTRSIIEVVRQLMEERGKNRLGAPIFVNVTQGGSFPDTLASSVNFFFDEHISLSFLADYLLKIESFPKRDNSHKLNRLLGAIEKAAFSYLQETGRPLVIVIDGVNNLTTHMPGALEKIQGKAKLWADCNIAKIVFVCNDESTAELMQSHASNWSRAAAPIYVGDLSKSQSVAYLREPIAVKDQGVDGMAVVVGPDEAERIYDLVGGRIYYLIMFKRACALNTDFEKTAKKLMNKETEKLIDISKSESAWKAIDMVRASGLGIPVVQLTSRCSGKDVDVLLKLDIIRIERTTSGMLAVFESKLTENVINSMIKYHTST